MKTLKNKFTKRKVLILANVLFFILICLSCFVSVCAIHADDIFEVFIIIFGFISSQCTFTALSLVVYYLAIMAGALNSKYKEEVEDNTENKK